MKLVFVELRGFRGYRKTVRIDFAERFTIVDGRNGVGKSTIFDAIEFALTGAIRKYDDQKASGESVADYIWWRGEGPGPSERYVKVGFRDSSGDVIVTRREFDGAPESVLADLAKRLCDTLLAPEAPLGQLCTNAIIRDEHITKLSLDLKETDRYALLRDALGASDSDAWIKRGADLVSSSKQRVAVTQQDVSVANADMASTSRRLDEVRSSLVGDSVLAQAVERLRKFANTVAPPDQLAGPTRARIGVITAQIDALRVLDREWDTVAAERTRLEEVSRACEVAQTEKAAAAAAIDALKASKRNVAAATALAAKAREIVMLAKLGRGLGLREGHCPLCARAQSIEEFEQGITAAEAFARGLDDAAASAAQQELALAQGETRLAAATQAYETAEFSRTAAVNAIRAFDQQREAQGISAEATNEHVKQRAVELTQELDVAQRDLRVLETLRLNAELERAQRAESDANNRLARAQERYGRARKAQANAEALYDAARRAASETLDRRLERVLPLMSELYRRLRPHPIWSDIEYSIRGDVRRFLKLQVGEELNPQFLFSSGQRRATGLAFLLSVNLSLAWSRWRTILLDDPVQHVDDFRSVHLAELMAQLVAEGRQVICAVEDAALADLLCRRLPVDQVGSAKRITLGADLEGAIAKIDERPLNPLLQHALTGALGGAQAEVVI